MQTLISSSQPSEVITDPFPHLIIKDALEENICFQLASEWPSINILSKGIDNRKKESFSNRRYHYLAKESLNDAQISRLWKKFITIHTSNTFLTEFFHIFKEHILQIYPKFEKKYGSFETLTSGVRKIDTFERADVLLDALISVNTPVTTTPTSVRRAHIDLPDKLFAGLFYMRDPEDTSTGGDLEMYKFKKGTPYGFRKCEIADKYVEHIKTIKYERNVLVLFPNSIYSLHGVTVRSLTSSPRYFVNLVGEVRKPLFQPLDYQESPHMKYLIQAKNVIKELAFHR